MAASPEKSKSLESWIWDAASSIRGTKDAAKHKDYILPLIEHFRDPERRQEFFKEYKEIEIISPEALLRPFIDDYAALSNIYLVVRNAYTRCV